MKKLTKIISVVLVLAMVMLLGGCSNEKDAVLGTWKTELNLAQYINEGMASADEEIAQYLAVDNFNLTMVLVFNDDDTYSMYLDESKVDEAIAQLKVDFRAGMESYLMDMIASMGVEMSVDELLEAMDMDMDALIDEAITEDMVQDIIDSAVSEGKYKVKDGKLYLSAGLNYEVDEKVYGNYVVDGNKLTIVDYNGEEDEFLSMYPLYFTK